jgi:hypothetical protein
MMASLNPERNLKTSIHTPSVRTRGGIRQGSELKSTSKNPAWCLSLLIKFYWNTDILINYGRFCAKTAEWSDYERDYIAGNVKNVSYLGMTE